MEVAVESGRVVLTRKTGEEICVGDDVVIEVREIRRNQVRIAVIAPKSVRVLRRELLEEEDDGDE